MKENIICFIRQRNQQDSLRIGLAVSEKPGGPFVDVKNEPLLTSAMRRLTLMYSLMRTEKEISVLFKGLFGERS